MKKVLLIGFYNEVALGVRYLANTLIDNGYDVHTLYFKKFNSINPDKATDKELNLLENLIEEVGP